MRASRSLLYLITPLLQSGYRQTCMCVLPVFSDSFSTEIHERNSVYCSVEAHAGMAFGLRCCYVIFTIKMLLLYIDYFERTLNCCKSSVSWSQHTAYVGLDWSSSAWTANDNRFLSARPAHRSIRCVNRFALQDAAAYERLLENSIRPRLMLQSHRSHVILILPCRLFIKIIVDSHNFFFVQRSFTLLP